MTTDQAVEETFAGKHICIVVNSDWFFLSHRLPIAQAALEMGARVTIIAGDTGRGSEIEDHGLGFLPLPIDRSGMNPLAELRTLFSLVGAYRRLNPDLVHHVTLKPVVYGSIATRIAGVPSVVNAVTGLGYAFADRRLLGIRLLLLPLLRIATRRGTVIVQNQADADFFHERGRRVVLIRGSGVDVEAFRPWASPSDPPIVVLAARMLWDKGVGEFVEAARLLRSRGDTRTRFVLVGDTDSGNRSAVPRHQLEEWADEGVVEWWGHRDDIPAVMAEASIVALPTAYGEGLPKVLLEGAAAGRALVASDLPGCREVVIDQVTGLVVPPRDPRALASAVDLLLRDGGLRRRYGSAAREHLNAAQLTLRAVVADTVRLYSVQFSK